MKSSTALTLGLLLLSFTMLARPTATSGQEWWEELQPGWSASFESEVEPSATSKPERRLTRRILSVEGTVIRVRNTWSRDGGEDSNELQLEAQELERERLDYLSGATLVGEESLRVDGHTFRCTIYELREQREGSEEVTRVWIDKALPLVFGALRHERVERFEADEDEPEHVLRRSESLTAYSGRLHGQLRASWSIGWWIAAGLALLVLAVRFRGYSGGGLLRRDLERWNAL
tara:strand:+ start:309 stop:1004 length:696 start_codon:yes stop_codon:yes gene_type:complete